MKFGTPVTVPPTSIARLSLDAPGGLGGEFAGGTLILDGTFPPGSERAAAILLRVPPQDAVPVLRFCAAVAAGQEMALTDPAGSIVTTSSGSFGPASSPAC